MNVKAKKNKNNRFLNLFKKWHRWPGLIFGLLFVLWAMSGIVMNHRKLLSSSDIPRKNLPAEYRYYKWNNSAVKGSVVIGNDSVIIYGNIGTWLTDGNYSGFRDFNDGFPRGIDNRKVSSVLHSRRGNLYAATFFGLYYHSKEKNIWKKIPIPGKEERITGLTENDGKIYILTRSEVIKADDDPGNFNPLIIVVPAPLGYDNTVSLFRTIWVIHSGEIYGKVGRLIVDLVGFIVIFLTITGILHFFIPSILKRRKKAGKSLLKYSRIKRFSSKWHNRIGIYIVLLLLLNTLTGTFLRPPFLITIADSQVKKIPGTLLDSPNAWEDKMRDILYDEDMKAFLLATSEGIYMEDTAFSGPPALMHAQPPVSVMGINVFRKYAPGTYLVGSFSGLYLWSPMKVAVYDFFTGDVPTTVTSGRPISDHMVTAYLKDDQGREYYFDYNLGAVPLNSNTAFSSMPDQIIRKSPISWWNFALEVHTGRIFHFLIGDFYILLIPVFGIFAIILLISGTIVWLKLLIRKRKNRKHCREG